MVNDSLDQGEEPYHLSQGTINESEIVEIKVKPSEIQLKSHIEMSHDGHNGGGDFLLIDSELVLKFDDKKEITGWEVINTKTRMSSEEATCQCCPGSSCHARRVAYNAA